MASSDKQNSPKKRGRPKKKEDKEPPIINIGLTNSGIKDRLVGKIISLNSKVTPFFMVGDIHLTLEKYWAKVSDGMPDNYYQTINRGLNMGFIVEGKKEMLYADRDSSVLDKWWELVKKGVSNELKEKLKELIRTGKDGDFNIKEIIKYLIDQEKNYKERHDVLDLLEKAKAFTSDIRNDLPVVVDEEEAKCDFVLIDGYAIPASVARDLIREGIQSSSKEEPPTSTEEGEKALDKILE